MEVQLRAACCTVWLVRDWSRGDTRHAVAREAGWRSKSCREGQRELWSGPVGRQEQQIGAVGTAGWGCESDRVGLLDWRGAAARARWSGARTKTRKERVELRAAL